MADVEQKPVAVVADDEVSIRRLVRTILEKEGWSVAEAANGAEALRLFERLDHVDLLISDLRMPVLNGIQLGVICRRSMPDMKVLYLTGHAGLLFEASPVLLHGEAFLDKPFTARGLMEAVWLLAFDVLPPSAPIPAAPPDPPSVRWIERLADRVRQRMGGERLVEQVDVPRGHAMVGNDLLRIAGHVDD